MPQPALSPLLPTIKNTVGDLNAPLTLMLRIMHEFKYASACPIALVPCPIAPVPCPTAPVPCPIAPVPCPIAPVPCPIA